MTVAADELLLSAAEVEIQATGKPQSTPAYPNARRPNCSSKPSRRG